MKKCLVVLFVLAFLGCENGVGTSKCDKAKLALLKAEQAVALICPDKREKKIQFNCETAKKAMEAARIAADLICIVINK